MDHPRPIYAWRPVSLTALGVAILLAATANGYGYHRDELYFRLLSRHLAWGYVDQPPMTPALVRSSTAAFGDTLFALRLPAIICLVVTIFIVAAITREFGGGPSAQLVAAIGTAGPFPLIAGHTFLTASPDMAFWTLTILFIVRALLRDEPRWWLWAGLTVGVSLWNKQLIVLLLLGLLAGLLVAGPRGVFKQWQLWAAIAIAVVVAAPTIIWQATNHWPELTMARAISRDKGSDDRVMYIPFQIILLLPVIYIWIRGLIAMFKKDEWRPVRALAWAYPVVSVIVLVSGGQIYYTFGLLALYLAAGCADLGFPRVVRRVAWLLALTAVGAVVALPIIPVGSLGASHIGDLNQTARDSVGWPAYVGEVGTAYQALSPTDRAATGLIAGNYGEAGALDKFGARYALPPVHSGQNQLYFYGPPPESAVNALLVGHDTDDPIEHTGFASCAVVGTLDNNIGVDNEEQGRQILYCSGRNLPWAQIWPTYQHYS